MLSQVFSIVRKVNKVEVEMFTNVVFMMLSIIFKVQLRFHDDKN